MEQGLKQSKTLEESKLSEEEMQLKMIMEQSKQEAEYQQQLRKKNDELLELMKQIEDGKPKQGWGQKAKKDETDEDQFNNYQENLQKAILKLEINDKAAKGGAAGQILEQTLD